MSSKLVRWETPFADALLPSAIVLVNRDAKNRYGYTVETIVSPSGLDEYPKFRIEFGDAVAFSAMEEMHFPEMYFESVPGAGEERSCSYLFVNSPWLDSYSRGNFFLFNLDGGDSESLSHYVIFGGDDVVQVVTKNEPIITRIDKPTKLRIDFEL